MKMEKLRGCCFLTRRLVKSDFLKMTLLHNAESVAIHIIPIDMLVILFQGCKHGVSNMAFYHMLAWSSVLVVVFSSTNSRASHFFLRLYNAQARSRRKIKFSFHVVSIDSHKASRCRSTIRKRSCSIAYHVLITHVLGRNDGKTFLTSLC